MATKTSQAKPRKNEPWALTHTHTTGRRSHHGRRRSTMITVRARARMPSTSGRGDHPETPSASAKEPASAVRADEPVRASAASAHATSP